MREYDIHLMSYKQYAFMHFSKLVKEEDWGDVSLAESYLKKYWLSEQEYLTIWKPIQDKVFIQGRRFPDLLYYPEFEMIFSRGGCLFIEEDFNQLKKTMEEMGDKYFIVVQSTQEFTEGEPMFKMKFPVEITWNEMISGNYISAVLLEMSYNEYFVFSDSGSWGRYSANDFDYPLDVIGCKPELHKVFQKHFEQSKEEIIEMREMLPVDYIKR